MNNIEKVNDPHFWLFFAACFGVALLGLLSEWLYEIILEKFGLTEERLRGVQLIVCPIPVGVVLYVINPGQLAGAIFASYIFGNFGVMVGPALFFSLDIKRRLATLANKFK